MPAPIVGTAAQELWDSLGPWAEEDVDVWDLLKFCQALGMGLDDILEIVRDTDDGPGWSIVMDVDRAPESWLSWLAQFVGVRIPDDVTTVSAKRNWIKSVSGFKRGGPLAIVASVQRYLTGTKTVFLTERLGSAYRIAVSTYSSETPDTSKVTSAVLEQKPGGIMLDYAAISGDDYATLLSTHSDYADVLGTYADYAEVLADPDKQ